MTNFEKFTELRLMVDTKYRLFTAAIKKTKRIDWDKIEGDLQVNCLNAKKDYDEARTIFETFRNKDLSPTDIYVVN